MSDGVDTKWAARIRDGDRRALARQFSHEASELRRILLESPEGVHPPWADFRRFLADVGPSPGPAYRLTPTGAGAKTPYRPGEVRWAQKPPAAAVVVSAPARQPRAIYSQWTMLAGHPVEYGELPARLGVPFKTISAATGAGCSLDDLAVQIAEAKDEVADLSWFSASPARQQAFRGAFLSWRLKVQVGYRKAATAKFLYLYTLLPAMAQSRTALVAAGYWRPRTLEVRDLRDASAPWKRFNELQPRAQAILADFEIYRQYSLVDDIDELSARVVAAERRFREGSVEDPPAP